ncbi:MAG TPA: hypothetical protein VFI84_00445 [Candidatus Saccharimonadales bacterium]|nr:hypothetical protein [Candidatus Saccharimonadales bacterium]
MDFKAALTRFAACLRRYSASLTWGVSLLVVAIWTVIRHWTNGVNFDVVGQVGLADQWAHGIHSGAQLGPTNYLLKMPVYVVVNGLGFLSPHAKLLVLALAFNLATFALLYILFRKILGLYGADTRGWLMLGFVWLASISGSVFWLDYANSRNLETAGGIAFLYVVLKLVKKPALYTSIWLCLLGVIVFFADPLQVYVTALPISFYVLVVLAVQRRRFAAIIAGYVIGASGIAFVLSKLLFIATSSLLHITYLAVPSPLPSLSWHTVAASTQSVYVNTLKVFDAYFYKPPLGPNAIRELLNALILAGLLWLAIKLIINWRNTTPLQRLLLLAIAIDYAVFVASGQALQWETARYLVMVPLFTILLAASCAEGLIGMKRSAVQPLVITAIAISCLLLAGALVVSLPKRYQKDSFITATVAYMQSGNYAYSLSSREVGIPASYFGFGKTTVLPLLCQSDHSLHASTLFYDQAAFSGLQHYVGEVPVILQPQGIKYGNTFCTKADVLAQFGPPTREEMVPGVGIAEIYPANQVRVAQ